jgi:hypothetical protein
MDKDEAMLKKYGVEDLSSNASGREILGRLQKKYWKECLQPSDPRFEKVYGKQTKESEEKLNKLKETAHKMWEKHGKKSFI